MFQSEDRGLWAWVNQQEHLKLSVRELNPSSADLPALFARLFAASLGLQRAVEAAGHALARDARLGWLCACPSRLGTALQARGSLYLPLALAKSSTALDELVHGMGLAGKRRGTQIALSNAERLGAGEAELASGLLAGVAALCAFEAARPSPFLY